VLELAVHDLAGTVGSHVTVVLGDVDHVFAGWIKLIRGLLADCPGIARRGPLD
jgi:hypothetical protein